MTSEAAAENISKSEAQWRARLDAGQYEAAERRDAAAQAFAGGQLGSEEDETFCGVCLGETVMAFASLAAHDDRRPLLLAS